MAHLHVRAARNPPLPVNDPANQTRRAIFVSIAQLKPEYPGTLPALLSSDDARNRDRMAGFTCKLGTAPDRFDAIARNFYWLNVTRFYAGCFSKGELPSLIERLQELSEEEGYRNTSHPRTLAAMLLSDWVFTQSPRSTKAAVDLSGSQKII